MIIVDSAKIFPCSLRGGGVSVIGNSIGRGNSLEVLESRLGSLAQNFLFAAD